MTAKSKWDRPEQDDNGSDDDSIPVKETSIRLGMWDFRQCDPKRCSGRRLARLKMLTEFKLNYKFLGIILTPSATRTISPADRPIVHSFWSGRSRLFVGATEPGALWKTASRRRTPPTIPGGRQHCELWQTYKLNCAEALAAGLYICGFVEDAQLVMSKFNYGEEFLRINQEVLDLYAECKDGAEVISAQNRYLQSANEDKSSKSSDACSSEEESGSPTESDYEVDTLGNRIDKISIKPTSPIEP